jgi:hypothetical protein
MYTGLIARGVLLGYRAQPFTFQNKSNGQVEHRVAHLIGLERSYRGKFNEQRVITQVCRIPDELFKNAQFMQAISDSVGSMVEVGLSGYQDADKNHYIAMDSGVVVCGQRETAAA